MYFNEQPKTPKILPIYSVIIFLSALGADLFIWYNQLNNQLFLRINQFHYIVPDKIWEIINLVTYTKYMVAPVILLLLSALFRRDKLLNIIILIISFFVIFIALKHFIGEARPYVVLPQGSFFWLNQYEETIKSAYQSFPSGHTGNIAMFAFACNYLFKKQKKIMQFIMLLLIIGVAIARICTGWHWPVDVITSGLISYVLVKITLSIPIKSKAQKRRYAHY